MIHYFLSLYLEPVPSGVIGADGLNTDSAQPPERTCSMRGWRARTWFEMISKIA
ncbi:recombinase RecF [Citrobacter amalonaticus]|uniref:Recombinase RecF n=1 Tax=Citrobacter amalonaticus TaxID=35703 RepID=A0A2S4S3C4_CITAM|nr:recombinase RecF [Citrobacter amalonaticus]POT77923.1 recombinase RecF [Citrobacter amalonaticus]POU68375.1 recombinase RecF [Citrobacter amalonaticus]POV07978.1 recombinase RecF [Citrobacter amalonaticus]